MPEGYSCPAAAIFDEDGRQVVSIPKFGWGALDGAIVDGSLGKARDLLRELIASTMREGKDLSEPSPRPRRQMLVVPPVQAALKAAFHEAFRGAVPSQRRLARELGDIEGETLRTLHPDKANKAAITSCATGRLGILLTMAVGEAA